MRHHIPSKVPGDETIAYICSMATYAWGVSIPMVMEFAGCSQYVAQTRIRNAQRLHAELRMAERPIGFRRKERRWFMSQEHAEAFVASRATATKADLPAPAGTRETFHVVELPTMSPAPYAARHGALDFRAHPSRRGDRLVYLDGRVEDMAAAKGAA